MIINQAQNSAPGSLRHRGCTQDLRCLYLGSRFRTDMAVDIATF